MNICTDCSEEKETKEICQECDKNICSRCYAFSVETSRHDKNHDICLCERCNLNKDLIEEREENMRLREIIRRMKETVKDHLDKQNDVIKGRLKKHHGRTNGDCESVKL